MRREAEGAAGGDAHEAREVHPRGVGGGEGVKGGAGREGVQGGARLRAGRDEARGGGGQRGVGAPADIHGGGPRGASAAVAQRVPQGERRAAGRRLRLPHADERLARDQERPRGDSLPGEHPAPCRALALRLPFGPVAAHLHERAREVRVPPRQARAARAQGLGLHRREVKLPQCLRLGPP